MKVCSVCDIVHNEKECPLCEAVTKISNLEDEIIGLKDDLKTAEDMVEVYEVLGV